MGRRHGAVAEPVANTAQLLLGKNAPATGPGAMLQPTAQHGQIACKVTENRENITATKSSYRSVCSPSYFFSSPIFCFIYSTASKGRESKDQHERGVLRK